MSRLGQLGQGQLLTSISPYPDRILAWDSHQKGRIWCREEIVYSGFAKIFTLKFSNRPLNKGRSKRTRVRRALSSPEHARRAPPRAPRRAKAEPTPLPVPAPIKHPGTSTVPLRTRSTSPEPKTTGVCPCTTCPRSPKPPPPWTGQQNPSHPRPTLEEDCAHLGEAPRARNRSLLRRRSQSTVAGLRPTAGERRPGNPPLHSSIPCAHGLYVTP